MMLTGTRFFAVLCVVGMAAMSAPTLASGGGEETPPEFNSPWGPVRSLSDLATGSLGVVESSWWRKPLLLAWYRFNGQPISSKVLYAFEYGAQSGSVSDGPAAANAWLAEAGAAAVGIAPENVAAGTPSITGNQWDQFENCPNDAWEQARRALAERLKTWGADSPALRNWLDAQHKVFARCPLGPAYFRTDLPGAGKINQLYAKQFVLPDMALPDPPTNAPILLVKDRAYQRAAALFYEGRYTEAELAFKAIAQDGASPWQEWGVYLAFRARLRNIQMMVPSENAYDPCQTPECIKRRADTHTHREAGSQRLREDVARAIVASKKAGKFEEARRLSDLDALVGARLDPAKRFAELAALLANTNTEAVEFRRAANDYLLLHRQFPPSEPMGEWLAGLINGYDPTNAPCQVGEGTPKPLSPYPDLAEVTCRRRQWSQESLIRFERTPAQYAWLFSAAVLANRDDPHVGKVLIALSKVPEDHPGAASFMLQRLRLGAREEGGFLASALMKRPDVVNDYSARNRVREYRLWHATNLTDFCRDVQREHGAAFDRDTLLRSEPLDPKAQTSWGWDYDGAWVLNYELPHSALMDIAQRTECLPSLRSVAISMAWSRAVLRKDVAGARQALVVMSKAKGVSLPPQTLRVQAIKDDKAFLLEGGLMIDGARTGGTCRIAAPGAGAYTPDYEEVVGSFPSSLGHFAKNMLNPESYAEWQRERQALDALPDLDSVWMQNVMAFAEAFPKDDRVPNLLRDAVYRTRMNWCAEPSAGKLSKAAFELLKRQYPKSKESLTTKYWFKPRT